MEDLNGEEWVEKVNGEKQLTGSWMEPSFSSSSLPLHNVSVITLHFGPCHFCTLFLCQLRSFVGLVEALLSCQAHATICLILSS